MSKELVAYLILLLLTVISFALGVLAIFFCPNDTVVHVTATATVCFGISTLVASIIQDGNIE